MARRGFIQWVLCTTLLVSCSKEEPSETQCVGNDDSCGVACSAAHPCPAGLFCGADQLCAKQCDASHACPNGGSCKSTGQCGPGMAGGAGTPAGKPRVDGGLNFGDSGPLIVPDANQNFDGNEPGVCARSNVLATRVTPTVVLVIDQSSSMNESLGSGSRWNVLRDFLLKSDGLIKSLEDKVRFGVAMYSASSDMPQQCPLVTSVNPTLNNFNAIEKAYRAAEPIDETPTGDSIDQVVASLPKPGPDAQVDPVVLILATDGEPDRCEELNPQNGQQETIDAVTRAFGMSIKTFVIGVGADVSEQHQQDVANAGTGHKAGDANAPYWTAGDDQSLRQALMDIIGAQVSCDVSLNGNVEGDACSGSVTLAGQPLVCKDKDGWELLDTSHIRLVGKACETFKSSELSMLDVSFPCGVVFVE